VDFDDLDTSRRETFELPFREQGEVPQFDILFVVDRPLAYDPVMMGAMDGLAEGAPGMLAGMSSVVALPDLNWDGMDRGGVLQIGVISSDLGAGGAALSGCDELGDEGILLGVDPTALEAAGITGCGRLEDPFLKVQDEAVLNMVDASDVAMPEVTVDHAIRCMVMTQMLRETSCPVRQPLGAFRKALDEHREGANEGFLRDDAGLAVVFITAEDDCSAVDPSLYQVEPGTFGPYTCFAEGLRCEESRPGVFTKCRDRTPAEGGPLLQLDGLYAEVTSWKPRSRVVVSVMAGPYGPEDPAQVITLPESLPMLKETCGDRLDGIYGLPGIRLELFRSLFQENSVFHEICDPQVDTLFSRLSQKLAAQLTYRCMPFRPADGDGDPNNGRQVDCNVRDVLNPDSVSVAYTDYYQHCDLAPLGATCWEVMTEEDCLSGYKMVLSRLSEPAEPYIVEADCDIDVTYVPPEVPGGP
jgi:hypothetical protein